MIHLKAGEDASSKIKDTEENKDSTAKKDLEVQAARAALYSKLEVVGNLVHDSVPVSNDEVDIIFSFLFLQIHICMMYPITFIIS